MKYNNPKNLILNLVLLSIISLIIISLSFSYFGTRIKDTEDSTTISTESGIIEIIYNGGDNINVLIYHQIIILLLLKTLL